jgi:hypothetical protein
MRRTASTLRSRVCQAVARLAVSVAPSQRRTRTNATDADSAPRDHERSAGTSTGQTAIDSMWVRGCSCGSRCAPERPGSRRRGPGAPAGLLAEDRPNSSMTRTMRPPSAGYANRVLDVTQAPSEPI